MGNAVASRLTDERKIDPGKAAPFLKWAGGKRWLVQQYGKIFPVDFKRYIEPFLGSGAVFFHLSPDVAILGDINKDLIDTYRALKQNWRLVYSFLQEYARKHSRQFYYKVRSRKPENLFEKAAWFIYLNRTCWNGLYRVNQRGEFNVPIGNRTNIIRDEDCFDIVAETLKGAELYSTDFEVLINISEEGDLLFVDPPYTVHHTNNGFIKYNEKLFSWEDQKRLLRALKKALRRGVKIIGTNAFHNALVEMYKEVFGEDHILCVQRASCISAKRKGRGVFREFIFWGNFELGVGDEKFYFRNGIQG